MGGTSDMGIKRVVFPGTFQIGSSLCLEHKKGLIIGTFVEHRTLEDGQRQTVAEIYRGFNHLVGEARSAENKDEYTFSFKGCKSDS